MLAKRTGIWVLVGVTVAVAIAAVLAPRVAQPLSYHQFADQRGWLGIPNFGNVASNLGFAIVGLWGLVVLLGKARLVQFLDARERWTYVAIVGFYVLAKALETWDRAIFSLGHEVSRHMLKRLVAGGAGFWVLRMLQKRKPVQVAQSDTL